LSKLFCHDNLERAEAAGEGIVVNGDVEAMIAEEAAGMREEKREIEHDERRPFDRVTDVHGGVKATGEKIAGGPEGRHFGGDENETAAGLQGCGDALDETGLVARENMAQRAERDGESISSTLPCTKSTAGSPG
jgi:hypothetical protein